MAENYGTLEGTLDEHGVLSGEMNDRATLEGEIQFGSGGGGVLDVFQNGQSVVQGRYAYVTVPTFLRELRSDDYHNTVTSLEIQIWNGKADLSDIPTKLSQLDNDANYVQDADYVHTDNNFTDEDKAAIGNIPENITDLSDVAVDNIQNGQVLKWDATQEKFVNANESGGGGDVTDVKVDGTSVVDPVTGEADIDLSGKADKVLDAVAGDFAVLLANGNCANSGKSANDMASKAEMSVTTSGDQTTIQLKSGTSATVINQHQDISGKADKSSLGTAAEKDSTALIVVGSTDLAEAGAVREAIDSAVASSYHHAGTKTCAELVASLLVRANEGNVYNMTDSGVTTADFIEGAGKPIEEGANVGIAKIAENTYKFDLLSGFIDTSNFIEKSVTSGFVKNDGSIDTNTYQQTEAGKGLSTNDYDNTAKGIVDGVTAALADKVDKETGKGLSTNDYTTTDKNKVATIDNKADKVSSATNGNLAGLNGSGNLTDSGWNGAKDTTSISGNPISISGLKANQLAVNPIITLEPIQDLHGQSKPYPAGGGKNKLNMSDKTISGANWVFNKSECVLSAGTYIFSWNVNLSTSNSCEFQVYDSTGNTIIADVVSNVQTPIQFTITQTAGYCRFYAATGGTFSKFMIRLSTESADYAPYENICPISGYDKIEVLSCGANLCPEFDTHTAINGAGQKYTYDASSLSKTPIKLFKGLTYYSYIKYSPFTVTPSPYVHKFAANGSYIGYNTIPSNGTVTFDDNVAYIYIQLNKNGTITEDVSTIQYNFNISDASINGQYFPYDKTTDLSESLGQTVYGLTHEVRTGKARVTWKKIVYDGSSDENWANDRNAFYIAESNLQKVLDYIDYIKCDKLQTTNHHTNVVDGSVTNCISGYRDSYGLYPGQNWIYIGVSGISDVASLKTWLSNNPIEVCYAVATPTEIQLTPHEISLLKDYAYVSTNGTNIALDYHNGELASLGDVAQVGETLNSIDKSVTSGTLTDLVKQGNYGIFYYELKKSGRLVELYLELYNVRYTTLTRIANVPTGFIPAHRKIANIIAADSGTGLIQKGFMRVEVTNTGELQAAFMGSTSENIFADVTLMYYV